MEGLVKLIRPLTSLQAKASLRKPGYLDACLKLGKLDPVTGYVSFTPGAWQTIRTQYALGLGDAIHKVAGPIGQALNPDCLDKQTGALKPGTPCQQREAALNKFVPNLLSVGSTP